jgi:hypothetical protein
MTDQKQIVLSCIKAINEEDFNAARGFVSDDMTFEGVLGTREGKDSYFYDMERMKLKYEVKKIFSDHNDVCVLYDLSISGVTVFTCGWYHLTGDKIDSLRVVFDPRPILATRQRR